MNTRLRELDALRGIAAMSIFLFHIVMILPNSWREGIVWDIINFSPLHFFMTGDQPVILFFVISGFVLSIIFFGDEKISYFSFVIKRILRLYIPYLISITFAILLCLSFSRGGIRGLGNLFNKLWVAPIDMKLVINHLLFLGDYNVFSINIVIWTLIHEMRISFIIPLLVLLAKRFSWKVNLAVGICFAILGTGIHLIVQEPYQPAYKSLFYVLMFTTGILLSKNRNSLIKLFHSFSRKIKLILFIMGLILYIYSDFLLNPILIDWTATVAVSLLLITSISSSYISHLLLWKPFQFLGKISYSLYLYHLPILLSIIYLFYGKLPLLIIDGISFIIAILISTLAWRFIEKPSMKLANIITKKYLPSFQVKEDKFMIKR